MSLVNCKCTNCGSNLSVDDMKDAAICEYCGSAFIVEKAVNNYNISNIISADVINIYSSETKDFIVRAGELIKYVGEESDIIIPDSVTHIGKKVFKGCVGLRSVTIPNSVTTICEEAFKDCKGLTSIVVPDSVTDIECGAFKCCSNLSDIKLPNRIKVLSSNLFSECKSLKSINIPDSVISIGDNAFEFCYSLTEIHFPRNLRYLGDRVFWLCTSLEKVSLPDTVESISRYDGGGIYSGSLRSSCIREFTIPKAVKKVHEDAFWGCDSLFCLTIHDGVEEFSERALRGCEALKVINASEEWKRAHWNIHPLLNSYAPKQTKGCYIATAIYGTYDCPELWVLRRYRDEALGTKWYGKLFIKLYYAVSPHMVKRFGNKAWFVALWKNKLDIIVLRLKEKGYSHERYFD